MKRHGNYILPDAGDLRLDIESGCSDEYIARQLLRLRQKHRNERRNFEKRKDNKRKSLERR